MCMGRSAPTPQAPAPAPAPAEMNPVAPRTNGNTTSGNLRNNRNTFRIDMTTDTPGLGNTGLGIY